MKFFIFVNYSNNHSYCYEYQGNKERARRADVRIMPSVCEQEMKQT